MRLSLRATSISGRTYEDALKLLSDRQREAAPKKPGDASPCMAHKPTYTGIPSIRHVRDWLHQIGHTDSAIDGLNVIHVAGTKGKGSTCAFTSRFLEAHARRTGFPSTIGLYTSPHLRYAEERICINSQPLARDEFVKYLFEVWDKLDGADRSLPKPRTMTLYFLASVHTFIQKSVDVAIFETHQGGEYDPTNIFKSPCATGITVLGMDHVKKLGPTIENIAWQKAGIMKSGSPAFVMRQLPSCETVIKNRAAEKGSILEFVEAESRHDALLGSIATNVQKDNAAVAIRLANAFLSTHEAKLSENDILQGIANFSWPGRFQELREGNVLWALDGAHNELSIPHSADWFANLVTNLVKKTDAQELIPKVLIFSQISERDGAAILRILAQSLTNKQTCIDNVIFTTYARSPEHIRTADTPKLGRGTNAFPSEEREHFTQLWKEYQPNSEVSFKATIEAALDFARGCDRGGGLQVLVTGSLYLVGGALRLLEPETAKVP